jgi:hypothetical protein
LNWEWAHATCVCRTWPHSVTCKKSLGMWGSGHPQLVTLADKDGGTLLEQSGKPRRISGEWLRHV